MSTMTTTLPSEPIPSTSTPRTPSSFSDPGPRLLTAGVVFAVFSAFSTRRALARRRLPVIIPAAPTPRASPFTHSSAPIASPPGYTSAAGAADATSTASADSVAAQLNNSGSILALEALTLATMNVLSWGMMLTGGVLWGFDIKGMDDMRRKVRGGLGVDGSGRTEQEVEEEMEEWVVGVLARKEQKEKAGARTVWLDEKGRKR